MRSVKPGSSEHLALAEPATGSHHGGGSSPVRVARDDGGDLSAILSAAVEDDLIPRNPCASRAVRAPAVDQSLVIPWPVDQVQSVAWASVGSVWRRWQTG